MRLHERSLVFDGIDVCEQYGLHYSSFEEVLPSKKLVIVSIPYGMDVDISDRLGKGGWSNGTHKLRFLLYAETEADRMDKLKSIVGTMHGRYASYNLTWDETYSYRGRASVEINHRSENVDVITVTISRYPWKVASVTETVDLAYGAKSNANKVLAYRFDRHKRYRDVKLTALTAVDGNWYAENYTGTWDHYGLGGATHEDVTEEVWQDDGPYWLKLVSSWLIWFNEANGDAVVRSTKFSVDGNDAQIDIGNTLGTYTVSNKGDIAFDYYPKQTVTLEYDGWDI